MASWWPGKAPSGYLTFVFAILAGHSFRLTASPQPCYPAPMSPTPFNRLTPAQAERLSILVEECAEVIQIIGKIGRHGYSTTDGNTGIVYDNRALLEMEVGHLRNILACMDARGDIDEEKVLEAAIAKANTWRRYLHHQNDEDVL